MSDPIEVSVQKLCRALLRASVTLTGVIPSERIFVQSTDGTPDVANKDRIVCSAPPPGVEVRGINPNIPKLWRVPCTVTLYTGPNFTTANMNTALSAIRDAIRSTADNSTAQSIINSTSICAPPDDTDDGEFETEDNGRKRWKVFTWFVNP